MKVLHAIWQPESTADFVQGGSFHLWAECLEQSVKKRGKGIPAHPFQVTTNAWPDLLESLGWQPSPSQRHNANQTLTVRLPSAESAPLPSPELAKVWPDDLDTSAATSRPWRIDTQPLTHPIKQLSDLHFLAIYQAENVQPGTDFLFWYWFTQELKRLLLRDHYLPMLVYRRPPKTKGKRHAPGHQLHGGWQWASEQYEQLIVRAGVRMPAACAAATEGFAKVESLLRHCAEVLLNETVGKTPIPATLKKRIAHTLLEACLTGEAESVVWRPSGDILETYRQWLEWRQRITTTEQEATFSIGFVLVDPPPDHDDDWSLDFVAVPKDDPSHRLALADYWSMRSADKHKVTQQFGENFERQLLLGLGLAARMMPKLWEGLHTAQPQSVALHLDEAFAFLKDTAWVLEDAGFKVIIPTWWTPQGRRRLKIRLRSSGPGAKSTGSSSASSGLLNLENLIQYDYQLAIGDQVVSEDEWQWLLEAKVPLVQFRGQWIELDQGKMREMLKFWQQHGRETPEMSLQELLKKTAEDDDFEIDRNDALAGMLDTLRNRSRLQPIDDLPHLKAALRDYQKRGVAWLGYLERLGLNGCLADDMGLGKTMQVLARLVQEREDHGDVGPTLLVAPTSVIGNWQKEAHTFAPHLATLVHHGVQRERDIKAFKQQAEKQAIVITSYTLMRKDQKLFSGVAWHRVVLDEAQNIKNPKAAQTKAILKINAPHRHALTGTPVENRLMDLWSIFNFINPGYLDTQARFRKRFELPVQRDNNPVQSALLKRLVEPFILRRVKTDKAIIKDLPDKVEAIQYCNLSKEQAALYETVVRDVEQQLEEKTGIARQGLMLSTLMRLKQICNHPAQYLQDGSDFTTARSHKLERLQTMLEEALSDGDSVIVFTQFTEIGEQLEALFKRHLQFNTYYLHGGTPRKRREQMISEFQDPEAEASIFVLSLKAGGVGITLTKANHVFHFDRWWNPAVEDQASDRAYRIGQEKNVFVHKFVTLGTLEERINEMITDKKALAGAIVGNDESWLTQLDNKRFKALIRLNREAVME